MSELAEHLIIILRHKQTKPPMNRGFELSDKGL